MFIVAFTLTLSAQAPQKMSYQAVIRNNSGALVTNQAVGMKISILQGSATGTVVYSETYSPNPQTNANGLVTVEIGGGTPSAGIFSGINWGAGTYYLKTETDPSGGTSYTITGTSQLLSVPYAMHAKTVESLAAETDPLFSASPAQGITVGNITNWSTAYGWGNHSGLYRPVSWTPSWADVTGKPTFATVATSGSYNDLTNRPALFSGAWADITGKPTTLAGYGITDADNSNTNEIQTLSLSGTLLSLSLGGGTVTLPSSGGGDNWGTQTVVSNNTLTGTGTTASPLAVANSIITPLWSNIQSVPSGFADGIDNVDDADNSITNEIQTLSLSGTQLSLSLGGGTVTLPSSGGGDNWGTQVVVTDATLAGNGTTATPLRIADNGVTSAKIADDAVATADLANNSVTSAKILDGTIATSDLADNSVTSAKILDGTISASDLADNAVTNSKIINTAVSTDKLANSAVTAPKLASMGATTGQVLKWSGTAWTPGADQGGPFTSSGGLTSNLPITDNFLFGSSSINNIAGTEDDARMFFLKSKAAFRAGGVYDTRWDIDSVGYASVALGSNTKASKSNTVALGASAVASGNYAIAIGVRSTAAGVNSTAMGSNTYAKGDYSFTAGDGTSTSAYCSFALGRNNVGSGTPNAWIETEPLFEIGIGISSASQWRKNAVTVLKNGNVGIGPVNPTAKLEVDGQIKITGGSPGGGKVLTSDANGLASWQSPPGGFSLPYSGDCSSSSAAISINQSGTGQAIYVYNPAETGEVTSISAHNNSSSGTGIAAAMHAASGTATGILGFTSSSSGRGVRGLAYAGTGINYGVIGESQSVEGVGVWGNNSSTTGITYGIQGSVSSSSGYSGYFLGGRFCVMGNVGIGSSSPSQKLHIKGSAAGNAVLFIEPNKWTSAGDYGELRFGDANHYIRGEHTKGMTFNDADKFSFLGGNVGIGHDNPAAKLDVVGDRIRLSDATGDWIALRTDGASNDYLDLSYGGGSLVIQSSTASENIILNPSHNRVGIRTWTPQYELDVNGSIRAIGSVYYGGTTSTAGTAYIKPDYVFEETYRQMSTEEVDQYLQKEKHLPWITSAEKETEENGDVVDMTRMAFETVETVENLQLQLIDMDKQIKALNRVIILLQTQIESLSEQLKQL